MLQTEQPTSQQLLACLSEGVILALLVTDERMTPKWIFVRSAALDLLGHTILLWPVQTQSSRRVAMASALLLMSAHQ
jgi:hypothetical protein